MRMKTFLIAALIIGAMTFPFRQNAMPVITHSASPATLTATAAAAQDINPQASYDVPITGFNPFSLLFGRNVLPGITHSAFPATLTAAAAQGDLTTLPTGYDVRIRDTSLANNMRALSPGLEGSPVVMSSKTYACDEAWRFVLVFTNVYRIMSSKYRHCLVVRTAANGALGVMTPCASYRDQLWIARKDSQGYLFEEYSSTKYLVHNGQTQVKQYSYNPSAAGTYHWAITQWDGSSISGTCGTSATP